jgi:hypothetical protein
MVQLALEHLASKGLQTAIIGIGLAALDCAGVDMQRLLQDLPKDIAFPFNTVLPGLMKAHVLEVHVDRRDNGKVAVHMMTNWSVALRALDIDIKQGASHHLACMHAEHACVQNVRCPSGG